MASQKVPDQEALDDDDRQYGHGYMTFEELQARYPNRPRNHSKTLPFHELLVGLFNPLNDNKKRPTGPQVARAKQGPHGPGNVAPHEARRNIIQRFISRWRNDVGNDFYPALRLIVPEKDRDRAMYGLKEKAIGKLLVKLLKINPNSEDGFNLVNWKLPGQTTASRMAGDFAGRCFEILSKRAMRTEYGDMRIAEVNELLDKLSAAQKEENQLPIFETFYNRMNADELLWLIRIILRQMKVGATEKTFLNLWHPDAEALFNVSSSLRRVCWELTDPSIRLEGDDAGISLMQCFQPQLAQFQIHDFQKMIYNMRLPEDETEFWIEEKLDGERMQLHMIEDDTISGGRRFAFWSRKAKEYTYLYGNGFEDNNSALTRHIKDAFDPRVKNIILDGEMVTWDPASDTIVGFGTLKSAAIAQQGNPFETTSERPFFKVFDCLYLNDQDLTRYKLSDRRRALEGALKDVHRRIEIHRYTAASGAMEIEEALRKVVAEASEGLVLKNPHSVYRLNSRNDDWQKVKPEYMNEFGENLDCIIIGGYYGSGRRGGALSSFLCGLRVPKNLADTGASPMKCWSFCKVGGGFRAEDYAYIAHHTTSKWIPWDKSNPPTDLIELGGRDNQAERPDVWIKPSDSVVVAVKAASVSASDQFRTGYTVRFPRFKAMKRDKDWKSALSVEEFARLKAEAEEESKEKRFELDTQRKRVSKRIKREVKIAGNDNRPNITSLGEEVGLSTKVFEGLAFTVLAAQSSPPKKSKADLEALIKHHAGTITQQPNPSAENNLIIADRNVVKVASLVKSRAACIVRPGWVLDAVEQAEIDGPSRARYLLPFEERHMFHIPEGEEDVRAAVEESVDVWGDSYARDVEGEELKRLMENMELPKKKKGKGFDAGAFLDELEKRGKGLGLEDLPGVMFRGCIACFVDADGDGERGMEVKIARYRFLFGGGVVVEDGGDDSVTHFIVVDEKAKESVGKLRKNMASKVSKGKVPRVVELRWVDDSWREKTRVDEEGYAV